MTRRGNLSRHVARPLRGAPGLHPSDVYGVAETVVVGWPGQPGGLAGGFAGAAVIGRAAVQLTLTLLTPGKLGSFQG